MRRKSTSERNVLAQSVAMDTEILDQERSEECSLQERHRAVIFTFSLDCSIPRPFCMLSTTMKLLYILLLEMSIIYLTYFCILDFVLSNGHCMDVQYMRSCAAV